MDQIYSLIKLFGERYIFCDNEQAAMDLDNREELVSAFSAILHFMRITKGGEDND